MSDVGRFEPGAINYDEQSAVYTAGRSLSAEAAEAWASAIRRHIDPAAADLVLDLGSGAGRFAPLLANALSADVFGLEPSRGMRAQAVRTASHERVHYAGGDGRWIPLRADTCDAAWIFNVIHHIPDMAGCARDVARVLKIGGKAFVTGGYPDRTDDITLFRFFPEARQVLDQFPTVEEVVRDFEQAGMTYIEIERVTRQSCASLKELSERASTRADTTLVLISDEAFERGMARLQEAAEAETTPQPVVDSLDMLVFVNG